MYICRDFKQEFKNRRNLENQPDTQIISNDINQNYYFYI